MHKYMDCINAARELRAEQVEIFKQWADMPTETAEKKIEKLEQSFNGLTAIKARLEAADLGGSHTGRSCGTVKPDENFYGEQFPK